MINPNMGISAETIKSSSPADALFPKVRQRVLGVLFGTPDRSFYANEIINLAQSGTGAVQRELKSLSQAGLLAVHKQGNQTHYQADVTSPLYSELRGLVLKTVGLADVLSAALAPVRSQISTAFIYGSMARQQDTAQSDVDVMIVSEDLGYGELFAALEAAAGTLGRKINPTVYSPANFRKRVRQDSGFVTKVMKQPKIWLIGSEKEIGV